jgi:hypothetical protein
MTETKPKFKNYQELCDELLRLFPNGAVERDNHGQILIYTGLKIAPNGSGGNKFVEMDDG